MQEDSKRSSISGQDDELGDTSVQGLGSLVGAFFQLTVVGGLLDDIQDLLSESGVGDGPSWRTY